MFRSMIAVSAVVAGGFIAAVGGGEGALAAEKEVYTSPGAERKPLFNGRLHGMEGHEITIEQFTFPAGWVGGKHYHSGPVFAYILEGALSVTEQGGKPRTFQADTLYREPIGTPMQARNFSASQPLKMLLIQVGRKGEPLMIKVD